MFSAVSKSRLLGISLAWYTYISSEYQKPLSTATYTIDGGAPQEFSFGANPNKAYNQKIMQTSTLPMGRHEMVVTYNGDSTSSQLSLDYIIVQNGSFPAASLTSTIGGSTGTLPVTATATVVSNPVASGSQAHDKGVLIGAVVGSVLGAVILALVSILLYRLLRGRQQHQGHYNGGSHAMENLGTGDRFSHAADGR